jgi:hypothetical protein
MKNTIIDPNTGHTVPPTEHAPVPEKAGFTIDLSSKVVGRTIAAAIALKYSTAISVNFSGNKISEEVYSIIEALKDTTIKIVNFADNNIAQRAPMTVLCLKDTGVIAVNLSGNNTTFLVDLECLDIALTHGHIRKLGLTHKEQCGTLLKEILTSLIHEEFKGQGYDENLACPVDLVFPIGIEMLIGEYMIPTIALDW